MIIDILFFHCSFVDMLNIISTCRDILCVDINVDTNVDKRCVDHSTRFHCIVIVVICCPAAHLKNKWTNNLNKKQNKTKQEKRKQKNRQRKIIPAVCVGIFLS